MMGRLALLVLLFLSVVGPAQAHDVRPGYLQITETAPETYAVRWKVPALDNLRLALYPRFPAHAVDTAPPQSAFLADAYVERRNLHVPGGLTGAEIAIDGLSSVQTDVLVRVERPDGSTQTERLTPAHPSFVVAAAAGAGQVAAAYLWLGVEHILFGIDHLLFVFALLILVKGWRRILLTITAFTLAHSITLTAATLGFVHVPGPPVEAAIALSIVLVAAEIVHARRGQPSLATSWPWLIALAFGLLHGFGFAGALSEIGLPAHAIPLALLFFNLGVELGQIAFVACVLALAAALRMAFRALPPAWARPLGSAFSPILAAYAIGAVATFWLIERTAAFLV